ncbi:DUF485 domain-containing protein [Psychrobacillus psychrodurans]|uniref:DUF485 domain-containing protein n=1 Tax=Psychrobacillus psychrodurans TaxID=126157 RepID=A0A9X3L9W8_9BACI|nr:DUF485 domain-containing protein [Psychrobacillus psychrodurans]MCZ8533832.1 DUF485 domain-containing protein [Psychrobacillus psychrodurans]
MANNIENSINSVSSLEKRKQNSSKSSNLKSSPTVGKTNYSAIAESEEFKALKKKKNKFILPMTIFFLLSYILLPILTSYTTILNNNAFGDIAWVWIYAFALFVMTWVLCMIYVRRANEFDKDAEKIFDKEKAGDYE